MKYKEAASRKTKISMTGDGNIFKIDGGEPGAVVIPDAWEAEAGGL